MSTTNEPDSEPLRVPLGDVLAAWQPIETAPRGMELLVGRWVNNDWRICQSGLYFDSGNEREGEPACWYWHCDWDNGGVTDSEGPTHWMALPAPPQSA